MFELIGKIFLWIFSGLFVLIVLFTLANALGKTIGRSIIEGFKEKGFKGTLLLEDKEYKEENEDF